MMPTPRSDQAPPAGDSERHGLSPTLLHSLRTPLNQIIGYSELLAEQAEEEGKSGFVTDLYKIRTAGRRLLSLIEDSFDPLTDRSPNGSGQNVAPEKVPDDGAASMAPDAVHPTPSADTPEDAVAPEAAQARTAPGATHGLLLVVDDNEMNRDMLARRLERQGYTVALAENGRMALEMVRAQAFDLVLLDIMMPEMDGYEALRQLKADEALRHIPVIVISALNELESLVRCIAMGAEDYLTKPFDATLLRARIGACLEKKRSHDREMALFEQLQQNYKYLQQLEKLRDDLTNMIVHDLRTPLTSVITGMQSLEVVGDLDEVQREMVGISISGGQTLLGMINDLLDVEKMESGAMELDYTVLDAAELVAAAAGQVASLSEGENLALVKQVAAGLPSFRGDDNKLKRVLVNLLGNAIKFTPASGIVTLDARLGENGECLLFSVSDTGEGIPPEAFERIFEKFGQVESRQRGRKMSTGLGLTFCKLAAEAHGGHISVESVPGQGSTFSFTIPLEAPAGPLAA